MNIKLPSRGFVFWPIGTGDSTTIVVNKDVFIQVDLNCMKKANGDDDPHVYIIDELEKLLPQINNRPYLSVFVLTHPDLDHCRGFKELLDKFTIGELWFTPRIFREYKKDLTDDAQAFRDEAKRRVRKVIEQGEASQGNKIRIIGYDELLQEDEYLGFPSNYLSIPGHNITSIDGQSFDSIFKAFVHAPFKEDSSGARNETSVALQISLYSDDSKQVGRAFLLGDHSYPTIKQIFEFSKKEDLMWNVFLSPHHCSKSVMYQKEEYDDEEKLKQDILDSIEGVACQPGYIIASSEPVPSSNAHGDNPPHAKAKARYEEIAPDGFLCTQEHPNKTNPEPILFSVSDSGFEYLAPQAKETTEAASISDAIAQIRGSNQPPRERVGFGK